MEWEAQRHSGGRERGREEGRTVCNGARSVRGREGHGLERRGANTHAAPNGNIGGVVLAMARSPLLGRGEGVGGEGPRQAPAHPGSPPRSRSGSGVAGGGRAGCPRSGRRAGVRAVLQRGWCRWAKAPAAWPPATKYPGGQLLPMKGILSPSGDWIISIPSLPCPAVSLCLPFRSSFLGHLKTTRLLARYRYAVAWRLKSSA